MPFLFKELVHLGQAYQAVSQDGMCVHIHNGLVNLRSGSLGLRPLGCYSGQEHEHRYLVSLWACSPWVADRAVSQVWYAGTGLLGWPGGVSAAGSPWDYFSGPGHSCMTDQLARVCVCWGWATSLFLGSGMWVYICSAGLGISPPGVVS